MKELIFVRHGKSSWEYEVGDKDRPLKERGIADGHLVAGHFGVNMPKVQAVYSSPANRALHTCIIFLRTIGFPFKNLEITDALYDFSGDSVLSFVQSLDDALDCVMIFGHNYAFTNLVNRLGNKAIDNVPTTGLVHLRFNTNSWTSLEDGITEKTMFPKQFK